ncbi:MAG TPA: PCRF domain-containing protein, partial [Thermoanaerobaculia bacterium]|nr:PCRF domain-containing protein [Thermoanaerobaculia bacterium]
MIEKLAQLERTHSELTQRLADPALLADHKAYADTNRALSEIGHVVSLYREYSAARRQLVENQELLAGLGRDDELFALAHEEREELQRRIERLEEELRRELTPKDPND